MQTLEVQMVYLESFQRHSDSREQNFLREQDTSSPGSLGSAGPAFTHIKSLATDNRGNPATSKGNSTPSPPAKATVESSPHESPSDTSPRSAIPGDASFDMLTLDESYMAQLDWHFVQSCARVDDNFRVAGEETPDIPDNEQIEFDDPELLSLTYQLPNAFLSSHPDID
ncbi:hypothetical protein DXG01_015781 [Tephrocybe rancida]|nr:hypothetical protein DXG01_015781 [Tephrocybe rancida]